MVTGLLRIAVLLLLSLSVGGGRVLAASSASSPPPLMAVPGESSPDATDIEAESLALHVNLSLIELLLAPNRHEAVAIDADRLTDLLLSDDHAARGPPRH